MEFEISLKSLRFHSYHGVLPQENRVGNEFIVDITLRIPYREEIADDNLAATISYADVYSVVSEEMAKPRALLETVADSICKRLKADFPMILGGFVSICKSVPPIANISGSAGVKLIF